MNRGHAQNKLLKRIMIFSWIGLEFYLRGYFFSGKKRMEAELVQKRFPVVSLGPSLKI